MDQAKLYLKEDISNTHKYKIIEEGSFNDLGWILGVNESKLAFFVPFLHTEESALNITDYYAR